MKTLYEVEDLFTFANKYPQAEAYIVKSVTYAEGVYQMAYEVIQKNMKIQSGHEQFREAKAGKRLKVDSILQAVQQYRVEDGEGNRVKLEQYNGSVFIYQGQEDSEKIHKLIQTRSLQAGLKSQIQQAYRERAEEIKTYIQRAKTLDFKYTDYGLVPTAYHGITAGKKVYAPETGIRAIYVFFIGYVVEKVDGTMIVDISKDRSKEEMLVQLQKISGQGLSKEFFKNYSRIIDLRRSLQ